MRTILKPGTLIDGAGGPPMENAAVVVEEGRIAWVGRAADLAAEVAGAEVVVAPDGTLLPGLIDAHVHLVCSGRDTSPREYLGTPDEQLLLVAATAAQAALRMGVTMVRDVGARGFLVLALRDAVRAGRVRGPRILAAGPSITTTGGHFYYFGHEADTADQLVAAVRTLCKAGVDLIKVMATGGNTTPGSNAAQAQYNLEQLRSLVDDAHRLGRRVAAHVHGIPGIRNAVEAGVDTLEHCSWLGQTGVEYDEATAERIADKGIFYSMALTGRYRGTPAEAATRPDPFREARLAAIRRMLALGVRVVASSDAGMAGTPVEDFPTLLETMVTRLEMSVPAAVRAATAEAAEALGLGGEVGTVARGRRADLLLLDGNPLHDLSALRRPARVLRDGHTVAVNGLLA